MLVLLQNEAYNIISMIDPELNDNSDENTRDFDIHQDGVMHELASIEDFKDQMLMRLLDHVMSIDDFNTGDEPAYNNVCQRLTDLMNQELAATDGLEIGDKVVSCDEVVYMRIKQGENPLDNVRTAPLEFRLRGKVEGLVVTSVPDNNLISKPLHLYGELNPIPSRRIGLALVLSDQTVEVDGKVMHLTEEDVMICIPLGHYPVPIKKVVQ